MSDIPFEQQVVALRADRDLMQEERHALRAENRELAKERDNYRDLYNGLRSSMSVIQPEYELAKAENRELAAKIERLAKEDIDRQIEHEKEIERLVGRNASLRAKADAVQRELQSVEAENRELAALFDLQHRRELDAIQRWREEDPEGCRLTMPDYGRLLDWLKDRLAQAEAREKRLVEALDEWRKAKADVCEYPDSPCRCTEVIAKLEKAKGESHE